MDSLPYWIGIYRVKSRDSLDSVGVDLHVALLITFETDNVGYGNSGNSRGQDENENEDEEGPTVQGIVYTPHGVFAQDLEPIPQANKPRIDVLALVHGLNEITVGGGWFGTQANLGAHNGLQNQRLLKARYWIGTHDEINKIGGIIGYLIRRKTLTVKEALEMEAEQQRKRDNNGREEDDMANLRDVKFVDLGNGESIALK